MRGGGANNHHPRGDASCKFRTTHTSGLNPGLSRGLVMPPTLPGRCGSHSSDFPSGVATLLAAKRGPFPYITTILHDSVWPLAEHGPPDIQVSCWRNDSRGRNNRNRRVSIVHTRNIASLWLGAMFKSRSGSDGIGKGPVSLITSRARLWS